MRKIFERLASLFRRRPIGVSLGIQVPADPVAHAADFAQRWADKLDQFAAERMEDLGIPLQRIGSSDHNHGIAWCAFNPFERQGGGNGPGGRINVDSGVFNPDLMTEPYGRKAAKLWQKSRLRDRIDAIIAHEISEADNISHEAALKAAPKTELPISRRAREICREMEKGRKS